MSEYGDNLRKARGYTAKQRRDATIRLAFRQRKAHLIKCIINDKRSTP